MPKTKESLFEEGFHAMKLSFPGENKEVYYKGATNEKGEPNGAGELVILLNNGRYAVYKSDKFSGNQLNGEYKFIEYDGDDRPVLEYDGHFANSHRHGLYSSWNRVNNVAEKGCRASEQYFGYNISVEKEQGGGYRVLARMIPISAEKYTCEIFPKDDAEVQVIEKLFSSEATKEERNEAFRLVEELAIAIKRDPLLQGGEYARNITFTRDGVTYVYTGKFTGDIEGQSFSPSDGILVGSDGSLYTGEIKDFRCHGWGELFALDRGKHCTDVISYRGFFQNGLPECLCIKEVASKMGAKTLDYYRQGKLDEKFSAILEKANLGYMCRELSLSDNLTLLPGFNGERRVNLTKNDPYDDNNSILICFVTLYPKAAEVDPNREKDKQSILRCVISDKTLQQFGFSSATGSITEIFASNDGGFTYTTRRGVLQQKRSDGEFFISRTEEEIEEENRRIVARAIQAEERKRAEEAVKAQQAMIKLYELGRAEIMMGEEAEKNKILASEKENKSGIKKESKVATEEAKRAAKVKEQEEAKMAEATRRKRNTEAAKRRKEKEERRQEEVAAEKVAREGLLEAESSQFQAISDKHELELLRYKFRKQEEETIKLYAEQGELYMEIARLQIERKRIRKDFSINKEMLLEYGMVTKESSVVTQTEPLQEEDESAEAEYLETEYLESEVVVNNDNLELLQSKLDERESENEELRVENEDLRTKVENLQNEIKELPAKCSEDRELMRRYLEDLQKMRELMRSFADPTEIDQAKVDVKGFIDENTSVAKERSSVGTQVAQDELSPAKDASSRKNDRGITYQRLVGEVGAVKK